MASNATFKKRQREQELRARKEAKLVERAKRREMRKSRPETGNDEDDPDLAGIVPGPQPVLEE